MWFENYPKQIGDTGVKEITECTRVFNYKGYVIVLDGTGYVSINKKIAPKTGTTGSQPLEDILNRAKKEIDKDLQDKEVKIEATRKVLRKWFDDAIRFDSNVNLFAQIAEQIAEDK